eukprot:3115233-Rhodomonas_salina.3
MPLPSNKPPRLCTAAAARLGIASPPAVANECWAKATPAAPVQAGRASAMVGWRPRSATRAWREWTKAEPRSSSVTAPTTGRSST